MFPCRKQHSTRKTMSNMMDDIDKYSQMWDKAVEQGVFPKETREVPEDSADDDYEAGTDFFGTYAREDQYDLDRPLNECDVNYWKSVSESAAGRSSYFNPLSEERKVTEKQAKRVANKLGSAFNPVYPNTVGKDQDVGTPGHVTPNWGVGGKELNDLEDLKKRLYDLEVKLSSAGIIKAKQKKDNDENTILKSMEDLKKQIDQLSDSLNGNRYDKRTNP